MAQTSAQLRKEIATLKKESAAMYAEYLEKRNVDQGAADYSWDTYQGLDLRLERAQAEFADLA